MWQYIITTAGLIVVAVIETFAAKDRKHLSEERAKMDARAQIRAEESRLSMAMMDANIELSLATTLALSEHKFNGELKAAKEKAERAQGEYKSFLRRIASQEITK